MRFKGLLAFVSALVFGGCAGSLSGSLDNVSWMRYLENDLTLKEISFYKRAANEFKFADIQASAVVKTRFKDIDSDENLGDIYYIDAAKGVMVIDLDKGKNVNISNKDEMKGLMNSKNIKFYEFGGGMIESVIYSTSEKSVCEAFRYSLEPINTRSVTNYYKDLSKNDEFFTAIIEAKIVGNKGFEIKNLDFKFHINQKDRSEVERYARSDKFKQEGIDQDMLKQGRFLLNVLCYSMFLK